MTQLPSWLLWGLGGDKRLFLSFYKFRLLLACCFLRLLDQLATVIRRREIVEFGDTFDCLAKQFRISKDFGILASQKLTEFDMPAAPLRSNVQYRQNRGPHRRHNNFFVFDQVA